MFRNHSVVPQYLKKIDSKMFLGMKRKTSEFSNLAKCSLYKKL